MVNKKEILDNLKKFNKDLEKHIPNLDFTYLNGIKSENQNEYDEYFSLLGGNLADLRTELALMRKNLSVEIEGMVKRTISEQQNFFLEQTNKVYGSIITDMKQNFNSYIKEMNNELMNLKKELNNISVQNEDFSSKLFNFNSEILSFKEIMEKFDMSLEHNKNLIKPLFSTINEINSGINKLNHNFNNDSNLFKNNLITLNKKISKLESSNLTIIKNIEDTKMINRKLINTDLNDNILKLVSEISSNKNNYDSKVNSLVKLLNHNFTSIENEIKLDSKLVEKKFSKLVSNLENDIKKDTPKIINNKLLKEEENFENKFEELESKLDQLIQSEKNPKKEEKIIILEEKKIKNKLKKEEFDPTISKIIDIDTKLSKLESLR